MISKVTKRVENLESSRKLIEADLVEVKNDVIEVKEELRVIMTNHLPHLQEALNHLILKSWVGLGSEVAILVTALVTLYSILKH
jgi:hypothetical protein